ncbi:MAG: metal-dependent transcriptional regulator [Ruminococcaceae bacterium]|nr:metal-dependent transcriptional regulator [Oscillospiraceae bacterium]
MQIKESAENYLETILMLKNTRGYVRSVDIANALQFSKPSISVAMKHFREEGYITTDEDGSIALTEKGMEIAHSIYERHQVIASALMHIGVNKETAYADSCKIEHDISTETFEKLKAWLEKQAADK